MDNNKISRRTLLKATATVPFIPALAGAAQDSTLKKRLVLGSGEHTYEVYHDWLTPPSNIQYGDTHGLCVDHQGYIYVAHTVHPGSVKTDAICVFDPQGKFVRSFGSEFVGGAHGLALRREGGEDFLYHCDVNHRTITKTDTRGLVLFQQGLPEASGVYSKPDQWNPTNIAFAPDGSFYVGDGYGSSYIHRYHSHGKYDGIISRPGSGEGQVNCPHGLWLDDRTETPRLVVADRANRRVQYMTLDGKHIKFVKDGIRLPCNMVFNSKGEMLIPDLESVVTILDKNDKLIVQLGDGHPSNLRDAPRDKFIPGKFVHPHQAIWLNDKDILVAEWVPIGRVTLLKRVDG